MGQQEYDNFKRLIKEWLDSHPNEYADFVEEMNDKKFKGFFKVFNVATRLVPKYSKYSVNHVFSSRTSIINFTSKKQSYDDTRRSGRDNELLPRAQCDL